MTWMVTISDSWHKSLRLHLGFDDVNILLLIMFDKNILLDCNIIKHYLSIVYIAEVKHFLYCVYCLYLSDFSWIENDQNSLLLDKIFYLSNVELINYVTNQWTIFVKTLITKEC